MAAHPRGRLPVPDVQQGLAGGAVVARQGPAPAYALDAVAVKHGKSHRLLTSMMREVHTTTPSTVTRANVSGDRKEAMLRAIAFSKARARGAKLKKTMVE